MLSRSLNIVLIETIFPPYVCFVNHVCVDQVPVYCDGVFRLLKRRHRGTATFTLKRLTLRQYYSFTWKSRQILLLFHHSFS